MKIHFIGIGGFGMSALAQYCISEGHSVTGSDISLSNLLKNLIEKGANINIGHSEDNLTDDTDLVVYTPAIANDNPELIKAQKLKLRILKRAELLGVVVNEKKLIAVSGTHGKTTTSAMIAYTLIKSNFDPTVFVGGELVFLENSTFRTGKSNIVVVEADEYDRSFLTLKPDIVVITNIDLDHLDIYKNIEDIKSGFRMFLKNSKPDSVFVANGDDENVLDVLSDFDRNRIITFGYKKENDLYIDDCDNGNDNKFQIIVNNPQNVFTSKSKFEIQLEVKGKHNALNCLASYITCMFLGLKTEMYVNVIKYFPGVRRRIELKYKNSFEVYDDYAHHPVEIKATFEALKKGFNGKMITIFQPHLYSRTKDFYIQFAESLKDNDIVILTDIYPAREEPIKDVSSKLIFDEIKRKYNCEVYYVNRENIISFLNRLPVENSRIIFQGAGDITNVCENFVNTLKEKKEEN